MQFNLEWDHHYSTHCIPNFSQNGDLPRHRWYAFKEGFSAELVNTAIVEARRGTGRNLRVLDPFSGSGTTVVTAVGQSCFATGIEVNPFMNFVGKTKVHTTDSSEAQLLSQLHRVLSLRPWEIESHLEEVSTFGPRMGKRKWLFNRSVLRGFESLYQSINGYAEDRNPFLLALIASAMDCSNARKDGKCLRYKRGWENLAYTSLELRERFHSRTLDIIRDISDHPLRSENAQFLEGDCRAVLPNLESRQYDLVLFSPPYLNSFDYTDVYRPELFLGRFVNDNQELRNLRARTLRSHVQYGWTQYDSSGNPEVAKLVKTLIERSDCLWDRRIPGMVDSYFADMSAVLRAAHRVTKRGGTLWMVVSTSAYAGVDIPVDLILADLATKSGWKLEGINVLRHLRSASQHVSRAKDQRVKIRLRESLVRCTKA